MARQRGFTLIELLVVVAIIGILASIALGYFAQYKKDAADARMQALVRDGREAIESFFLENGFTYVGATVPSLEAQGFRKGDGELAIVATAVSSYQIRGCYPGGNSASFLFDSDVGVAVPDGGGC